jgi:hypothetical protein
MQTNMGARTWIATLGGLGPALYRGVMSHPSVVATGVTPETLYVVWDALSAAAAAFAGLPAVIAAKLLSFLRAAPARRLASRDYLGVDLGNAGLYVNRGAGIG